MTTKHLIHQFKLAINDALSSSPETRAMMRARSGKQRFPVAQWVEDLEILQTTSIEKHEKFTKRHDRGSWRASVGSTLALESIRNSNIQYTSREQSRTSSWSIPGLTSRPTSGDLRRFGSRRGPGHVPSPLNLAASPNLSNESVSDNDMESGRGRGRSSSRPRIQSRVVYTFDDDVDSLEQVPVDWTISPSGTPTVSHTPNSGTSTPRAGDGLLGQRNPTDSVLSLVSVGDIVKEKLDYNLQKVSPFFTDVNHEYADMFEKMLAELNGKNSEDQMCIEEIIEKSEKDWFNRYRDVKLGKSPQPSPAPSVFRLKIHDDSRPPTPGLDALDVETTASQFLLPHDYVPPTGLKRFMLMKLGDWPVYSIILAIVSFTLTSFRTTTNINTNLKGQILAFNSYQITLLNGQIGQTAEKLYIVASIYLASSIVWWIVLRLVPAVYVLTVPFLVRYHSSSLFYRLPF